MIDYSLNIYRKGLGKHIDGCIHFFLWIIADMTVHNVIVSAGRPKSGVDAKYWVASPFEAEGRFGENQLRKQFDFSFLRMSSYPQFHRTMVRL